jgi:N-acetylglucosaminyldiphosphoundecaprenol N-acetyl-beta-D-mannosaminyltransferase
MTGESSRVRKKVVGSQIDITDMQQCLDRTVMWASRGESRYVCACNVHTVVTARREPAFAKAIDMADLATPDGAPIAWCLRRAGASAQRRIAGPDLMWRCCARAAAEGLPIFLYGARNETLRRLCARLVREFPGIVLAGCHAPPFRSLTPSEDERIVRTIEDRGARIVFVALGCPRQELWMAAHRGRIHAVMIGVGAAFDFHAGVIARAPQWMQAAGLEWLYRLSAEPLRLWRRYLVTNTRFLVYLLREIVHFRGERDSG